MVGHRRHGIPMQGVTERPRESCPVGCVLHCRWRRPQPICSRRALVGLATDCGVRSVGRRSAGHDWTGLARGQKVGERRGGSSASGWVQATDRCPGPAQIVIAHVHAHRVRTVHQAMASSRTLVPAPVGIWCVQDDGRRDEPSSFQSFCLPINSCSWHQRQRT